MSLAFPSREFDEAVAAVCHGSLSDAQAGALNSLLKCNPAARDEYLLRLEIHARLASDPDLFADFQARTMPLPPVTLPSFLPVIHPPVPAPRRAGYGRRAWIAVAAGLAIVAGGWWGWRAWDSPAQPGLTSTAVAMLNRTVDVEWQPGTAMPRQGAPLEPGWLRLETGLAQIVFYSGARIAIQGPAELELVSPNEANLRVGRLTAEVPPQARGFRIGTPRMNVRDLGTTFGLAVTEGQAALHVFKGTVELLPSGDGARQELREGEGVVVEGADPVRSIAASRTAFAALFDLQSRSMAAESMRYDQWRAASARLNNDPSLLVHLDFETGAASDWRLRNLGRRSGSVPDAALVGCQSINGRWPEKRALEFQSVSDRVRLSVPGEFESLTLAAWVRVQGLDRKINSLFMCDGFAPGTVHWLIRNDGVLGLTVIGSGPRDHQIVASPPVLTVDRFGQWLHLAVVLDGDGRRVVHYVNGQPVGERALRIEPPFRIDATELGNWNARGFPGDDPFLIRNFSGAMDEFLLFGRALEAGEIHELYADGEPQPGPPNSTAEELRELSNP